MPMKIRRNCPYCYHALNHTTTPRQDLESINSLKVTMTCNYCNKTFIHSLFGDDPAPANQFDANPSTTEAPSPPLLTQERRSSGYSDTYDHSEPHSDLVQVPPLNPGYASPPPPQLPAPSFPILPANPIDVEKRGGFPIISKFDRWIHKQPVSVQWTVACGLLMLGPIILFWPTGPKPKPKQPIQSRPNSQTEVKTADASEEIKSPESMQTEPSPAANPPVP